VETRERKSARLQAKPKLRSSSSSSKKGVVGANKSTKRGRTKLITDDNDVPTSEDEAQAKGPAKGLAAGQEAMEEEEGNPITNVRL
jgi:hypothetical protein